MSTWLVLRSSIVLLAVLAAPVAAHGESREPLRFVDDLGEAIQADLEVCFRIGTRNECVSSRAGAPVRVPPEAEGIRVEGTDHGPIAVSRAAKILTIPRKTRLEIAARSKERITVSIYSQGDPTFRSPVFRGEVQGGSFLKIPAGKHLASLVTAGSAPDLHLLKADPGGRHRLAYTPRRGWSLVLRCLDNGDGKPVPKAAVKIQGVEGFSAPGADAMSGVSVQEGLALFSGIPHLLGSAVVEHPSFVPNRQEGLSASPGTFAFREVRLSRGATLRATVTVSGRATEGVACQVLSFDPNPTGPLGEPEILYEGTTSKAGICRSGRLAAGAYTLRLNVPESRSRLDRSVTLADGQETAVDVALVPIHVHGKVARGAEPAPDYVVTFSDMDELKPNQTRRDVQAEATTDEEGEYEAVPWAPSEYAVGLRTPKGAPAAHKRVRLASEEERVDFSLEEHDVTGVVVDDRDRPVEGARVMISLRGFARFTETDESGSFSLPLSETGQGRIAAAKAGYVSPDPIELTTQPGSPPPPMVVRMRRAGLIIGKVFSRGAAAGAILSSYRIEPGGRMVLLGRALADAEGRFEIAAAEGGPTRLFVTGAGCPLTSFDAQPSAEETVLRCPELPASAALYFQDTKGLPAAGRAVLARHDGGVIPAEVLREHLNLLRLPAATDSSGRLLLVGLAPGNYDLYLAEATFPELVAQGASQGFPTSAALAPLTTSELQVTLEAVSDGGRTP